MASLLNKTTSSQLGIGGGDSVADFAAGVKKKRKAPRKRAKKEIIAGEASKAAEDIRLKAQAGQEVTFDAKADGAGANLMLNTNDESFIGQVQKLKANLFSGAYKGGGGAKQNTAGFLALADSSSRGGLSDVWNDTIEMMRGDIGPTRLAKLQESFNLAYGKTNKVLNLDTNVNTYQFDAASNPHGAVGTDLKGEKGVDKNPNKAFREAKRDTRLRAKANKGVSAGAEGSFAWDIGAQASDLLAIEPKPASSSSSGKARLRPDISQFIPQRFR